MNDSNSPSQANRPRPTLKLKVAPRPSSNSHKPAAIVPAQNKAKAKPGAHWSDEYKAQMQSDMDALTK